MKRDKAIFKNTDHNFDNTKRKKTKKKSAPDILKRMYLQRSLIVWLVYNKCLSFK